MRIYSCQVFYLFVTRILINWCNVGIFIVAVAQCLSEGDGEDTLSGSLLLCPASYNILCMQ